MTRDRGAVKLFIAIRFQIPAKPGIGRGALGSPSSYIWGGTGSCCPVSSAHMTSRLPSSLSGGFPFLMPRSQKTSLWSWAIFHLYSFLLPADKAAIAKEFAHVNERELAQMVLFLVLFRNVCAHGERLLFHRAYSDMPDTCLHRKLGIVRKGQEYTQGKRDLFGCVIALRYLLSKEDFLAFKRRLASTIDRYLAKTDAVGRKELYAFMGFPDNWKDITRYRI